MENYIETSNIPKRYGGSLDWEFGDLPLLEPEILKVMDMGEGVKSIPIGPIRWQQDENASKIEAHALGSELGRQRNVIFAHISSDLVSKNVDLVI